MEQVLKPENILSTAGFEPVSSDCELEGVGTTAASYATLIVLETWWAAIHVRAHLSYIISFL